MKSWKTWLTGLGLILACFAFTGCGGGSSEEADSSEPAVADGTPPPTEGAPEKVAEGESAPEKAQAEEKAAPESASTGSETASSGATAKTESESSDSASAATNAAPAAVPATAPNAPAATAEMLAQSSGSSGAASATSGSQPGAPGASYPGSGSGSYPGGAAGSGAYPGGSGYPGAVVGANPGAAIPPSESMARAMSGAGFNAGGVAGGYGNGVVAMPPGTTDDSLTKGAADFRTPLGGVAAFISAVRAKNLERLAEATALRAPTEAAGKNQKMFTSILEQSLSSDDLDELAKKLEGFQIVGTNQPKSSGKLGVILSKPTNDGGQLIRTVTARHEKAGWKVVDISGVTEMERPLPNMRVRGGTGRRR